VLFYVWKKITFKVILPTHQYDSKIQNFLLENNFHTTTTDPTKTFQTQIRKTVKESKNLTLQDKKMEIYQLEPYCPLHKRVNKNTQTRSAYSAHCELAQRPSLQTIQTVYTKD
jgi:hypothetical protein